MGSRGLYMPSANQYFGEWLLNSTYPGHMTGPPPAPGGVPMIKVSKSSLDRDGTIDTGLGTGSYQEDQMSGDQHKIIGSIHTYSDGTESSASNLSEDEMSDNGNNRPKGAHPGDLDSDAALQVDHKYKQILKHKRGGYLKGFKGHKGRQSDLDSVRTEDFEEMFQDFMIMPTLKETSPDRSSQSKDKRKGNKKEMEEASPSKLNNPHKEYKNALLAAADLGGVGKPVGQMKSKRRRKGNGSGPSDHESVRTEDYENHFHNMMVKQVAHVPITSFDQLIVDSDLETVKSLLVHTKFQNALNKSGMTDASEMSSSDAESAISMGRYAPHKADMMKLMGMDPAASEKLHANPESDAKLKPSKHSHKRNSNRHHQYKTCSHGGEDAGHRHSAPSRQLSGSTPNLATVGLTSNTKEGLGYYETQRTIRELNQLTSTTEKARREKQSALEELKSVQKILERNRSDIRQTERLLKENRAKAEDVRTQLVLVEFKRDSAQKDLQTLTEELQNTHHRLREGGCEWEETGSGGMTREQVSTLIAENEMLKARSGGELLGLERSGSDLMGLERRELQRQLETTKQELFAEQKRFRDKMEALQEDLDTRTSQYEEAVSAQEELVKKQAKLDAMHKQMEKDKNAIIQEKSQEYDDLKDRLEKHIAESRSSSNHQTVELNQQITDLTDRLTKCQAEMGSKETLTMQLREQILELQAEINQETEAKEILAEESKKNRENLHKEKVEAVEDVRKLADKEKTAALESQRQLLEAQHLQLLAQAEQQLLRQMNDIQTKLSARAVELDVVKERLGQQESMARDVGERVRQETQEHIRSMLELEHQRALSERDREIQHQISDIKDNAERNNRQLQNELLQERDLVDKQERQINALKQELEEQRDQNRQLYREKLSTMNEIKESAELVREREIDNIRTQVEKDIHRQMDRLRETVRKQEAEIDRFRTERQEQLTRERETVAAMDKLERGIVSDLNEECRKVAEMIGVTPRRANIPGFSAYWTANKTGLSMQSPTRMALNAAVSNLRSGNDELKKHVNDTRQELEKAKHSVKRSEAQKMEELELLRQKMQKEKAQALDILKDRLIKEHIEEVDKLHKSVGKGKTLHKNLHEKDIELRDIQRNMIKWREETANKLAVKFQEEMNRQLEKRLREYKRREKEWEKEKAAHQREVEQMETELRRTTMNAINVYGTPTRPSRLSRPPSPALSLHDRSLSAEGGNVRQLQIKVKQLQHENSSLRGGNYGNRMSSSTSDLTAAHLYSDREPEHRVRQAESRAKVAEHRAEQNEVMLNQKIHENSKMQGSLTQQSKELMQLERAYSLLQNRTAVHSLHNSLRS